MLSADRDRAHAIDAVATALAEWIVDLHAERDPSLLERYGASARRLWKNEVRLRLNHLAESISVDRPALFVHAALWSREAFSARALADDDLRMSLECTRSILEEELPPAVRGAALEYLDRALTALADGGATLDRNGQHPTDPAMRISRIYLLHLLQRDQEAATKLVFEALGEGKSVPEVYESIFRPALHEVGRMWQLQEASVADEHYVTAATQVIMAQMRARMPRSPSNGKRVLAASVGGDLHDVGIRMVSDLFEMRGWRAEYLGSNMPAAEILRALRDEEEGLAVDLLAISASTNLSIRAVADLIAAIRADPIAGSIPILVGGGPFLIVPDLWQIVGADGFACDASGCLGVADRLVASGR